MVDKKTDKFSSPANSTNLTVYFWSHQEKSYKTEKWRNIFSQWYHSKKGFIGRNAIYDLSSYITQNDWNILVLNTKFELREQWMMYLKALVFAKDDYRDDNLAIAKSIIETSDPAIIKRLGRIIKGFNEDIWNKCKFEIVVNGNYLEFSQNKEMKNILLGTGTREIVEASPKDFIWGIGFNENNAKNVDKSKWGLNLLGKALMQVRSKLI